MRGSPRYYGHETAPVNYRRPNNAAEPRATEADFSEASDIYRRAKSESDTEARISCAWFVEKGGLETARYLLHASKVSDGYTALGTLTLGPDRRRRVLARSGAAVYDGGTTNRGRPDFEHTALQANSTDPVEAATMPPLGA